MPAKIVIRTDEYKRFGNITVQTKVVFQDYEIDNFFDQNTTVSFFFKLAILNLMLFSFMEIKRRLLAILKNLEKAPFLIRWNHTAKI